MIKLNGLPDVNVITLNEHPERLQSATKQFNDYGVFKIRAHRYKKYEEGDCNITGEYVHMIPNSTKGAVTSHLKAIKWWYEKTKEDVGFFCEDDISLDTVKYWNFEWQEFYDRLPKNFGAVQLVLIREENFSFNELSFRKRNWNDWSACAYLLTRSFAKKLLDIYYKDDEFTLNYLGLDILKRRIPGYEYTLVPVSENILFSLLEPVYVAPLFLEDVKNFSTLSSEYTNLINENNTFQGLGHHNSYNTILSWWQSGGLSLESMKNVDDTFT